VSVTLVDWIVIIQVEVGNIGGKLIAQTIAQHFRSFSEKAIHLLPCRGTCMGEFERDCMWGGEKWRAAEQKLSNVFETRSGVKT